MPRGRLTPAILPILAGTAAALLVSYAPRLSGATPAPLAGHYAVAIWEAAHSPQDMGEPVWEAAHSPRDVGGPVRAIP